MKRIIYCIFVLLSFGSYSMHDIPPNNFPLELNSDWQVAVEQNGVLIEYKLQECNNLVVTNQALVLFRYTNTTSETKALSWATKEFRNGECSNCDRLESSEMLRSMLLSPGEVREGDGSSKTDKTVYLFSHFIELVPGMTEQRLTNFELVNLTVQTIQTNSND